MDRAGRCEQLACGADVDVSLLIECEVGAREGAVISLAHIPNGNMWLDASSDQPTEELASAVGRISGETLAVGRGLSVTIGHLVGSAGSFTSSMLAAMYLPAELIGRIFWRPL